jgi:hypothetical protein
LSQRNFKKHPFVASPKFKFSSIEDLSTLAEVELEKTVVTQSSLLRNPFFVVIASATETEEPGSDLAQATKKYTSQ